MPWKEMSVETQRLEFVRLALKEGSNVRQLCQRYRITQKTGYQWIERYENSEERGLQDHSRRPRTSPKRTPNEMEMKVLEVRELHPKWGGRKIHKILKNRGVASVPSASTITEILRRHNLLDVDSPSSQGPWKRFEHANPNDLWQMDFKGHFPTERGRCHPLTVLDDHSRYSIGLEACRNERETTVKERLTTIFLQYGVPRRIGVDNGPPWGSGGEAEYTRLVVWMIEQGITVTHSRPFHPQTRGKDERFHRTLKAEAIEGRRFSDLAECQQHFDDWRTIYNFERPHEALGLEAPISRYEPSPRQYIEDPKPFEYVDTDILRKVDTEGKISFRTKIYRIGRGFRGRRVALKQTERDGILEVYYRHQLVTVVDLHQTDD